MTKKNWTWKEDPNDVGESWEAKRGPITLDVWNGGDEEGRRWLWAVDISGGPDGRSGYVSLYGKAAGSRETAMKRAEERALKFVESLMRIFKSGKTAARKLQSSARAHTRTTPRRVVKRAALRAPAKK